MNWKGPAGTVPQVLGLLPDASVSTLLTPGVRTGAELPAPLALRKASTLLPESELRWHTSPLLELFEEAKRRFDGNRSKADAWLAPRLHATMRMSRSEAADSARWNFVAMAVAPDYVVWRHRGAESVPESRFCGPHYVQAFARLWWAAELFRNGHDYQPVEVACAVQDVLNTTMRLDVIDHRPTALAIIRLLSRLIDNETPRLGDHVNALSSAVNAAGSTLVYDTLTEDVHLDAVALQEWIADADESAAVPWERLPDGPRDTYVGAASVQALLPLFEQLLAEAPIRRRSKHSSEDGSTL